MDVLKKLFNKSVNQASPVQPDTSRVVRFDEDGNEFVSYEKTDYPSIQASHGFFADWSLDALVKAGINPDFPIHTGMPTRIEGASVVAQASAVAESILSSDSETE